MLTILTFHQIGALSVLFSFSMLIAFCPLLILRWFYKRKKRRLRRLNNNNNQQNEMKNSFSPSSPSSSSSSISDLAIAHTLHVPEVIVNSIRSLNGGLLLATLFLIFIPQLRINFDTLMNSYVYKSQLGYDHHYQRDSEFNSLIHMPEPEPFIRDQKNDSQVDVVFDDDLSINTNNTETMHTEKFTNVNSDKSYSHLNNILVSKFSPIPIVEVILCLAFFALYFIEEFTQLCFRYRKYFWALNSTVVLSSSDGQCNYTSLDYRINCTKRFLIDCSRKTFTASNYSSSGSSSSTNDGVGDGCERTCSTPSTMMSSNDNNSANYHQHYHHMDKMMMIPGFTSTMTKINPLVQNESFTNEQSDEQNIDDINVHPIKQEPTNQNNSLKLSLNKQNNNDLVVDKNFVNHNEPQSLLSNSSAHLPSYYWQQQPEYDMIANHCPHHQPSTIDENLHLNIFNDKFKYNHHSHHHHHHNHNHHSHHNHNHRCQHHLLPYDSSDANQIPKVNDVAEDNDENYEQICRLHKIDQFKSMDLNDHDEEKFSPKLKQKSESVTKRKDEKSLNNCCCCSCCCNCCSQFYDHSNVIPTMNTETKFDSSSTASGLINNQTLEKIFLPNTTQSTNMPALYIGEGILIAIQPSVPLLWLMLFVILMHKMANGLAMANELHYRTTGRQRNLPSSTILMFTSLPSLGCLSVIVANILIYWKINLDFATVSIRINQQQHHHHHSNHTTTALPLEFVILKVILVSLSAATLLHLIMLTIQQRNYNYWSTTMNTKNNRYSMGQSSSMKIDNKKQKKLSSKNEGKERKFNRKQPTTKLNSSYSSNSHNNGRIFQNSTPIIGPTSILTTLSKEQQKFLSMTISSTASRSESKDDTNNNNNDMPITIDIDQNITNKSDYENGTYTNNDNIPIITINKNNVLHYFIMYSGFIIILMAIAFLNFKNFKF
ncbi:uncharacterized protein LOC142645579 [Dermatophagoides pteronyssinus]|uniref:GATA zinc finger domain-containing protein 14-like n=1 Tax=Dermatophagoides pteronyssinus TaxID=6956 RepID=A0ABQ8JH31_DERPT|nr:hypothetical protein DERP_002215 [Dermatophagoides pteronyssinus]